VLFRSESYTYGENSIGAPDGIYTYIYVDYSNGYITLDMGQHEEIIDGTGFDFSVVAAGDNYSVYIGDSLETSFIYLGRGIGSNSFDLSTTGLQQARYVRIAIFTGDRVDLDAIVANHYNVYSSDEEGPLIESIDDFSMPIGEISVILNWTASDSTPWSYEIFVNSTEVKSGSWNGSSIIYVFEPDSVGLWNVTIILYDGFGNIATDTVMIEVVATSGLTGISILLLVSGIGITATVVIAPLVWKFKRVR